MAQLLQFFQIYYTITFGGVNMYFDLERLRKQVADVFDEVTAFRRDIHMHPELSEHEARTETKICDWLNALDIPYEKRIAGHRATCTEASQQLRKRRFQGELALSVFPYRNPHRPARASVCRPHDS